MAGPMLRRALQYTAARYQDKLFALSLHRRSPHLILRLHCFNIHTRLSYCYNCPSSPSTPCRQLHPTLIQLAVIDSIPHSFDQYRHQDLLDYQRTHPPHGHVCALLTLVQLSYTGAVASVEGHIRHHSTGLQTEVQ
jgi:hypothetical protein